jgi:N6-L-threonylcarbamoyladenine synthase
MNRKKVVVGIGECISRLGINPKVAVDLHRQNIDAAVHTAMTRAGLSFDQLTHVAVTRGPGIGICLDVGLAKAKALV